jgi:hypothetical protein
MQAALLFLFLAVSVQAQSKNWGLLNIDTDDPINRHLSSLPPPKGTIEVSTQVDDVTFCIHDPNGCADLAHYVGTYNFTFDDGVRITYCQCLNDGSIWNVTQAFDHLGRVSISIILEHAIFALQLVAFCAVQKEIHGTRKM